MQINPYVLMTNNLSQQSLIIEKLSGKLYGPRALGLRMPKALWKVVWPNTVLSANLFTTSRLNTWDSFCIDLWSSVCFQLL
jgi:hypothetical protein